MAHGYPSGPRVGAGLAGVGSTAESEAVESCWEWPLLAAGLARVVSIKPHCFLPHLPHCLCCWPCHCQLWIQPERSFVVQIWPAGQSEFDVPALQYIHLTFSRFLPQPQALEMYSETESKILR